MANGQDQFQYVKLPNGEYGKFRSDATDAQIRAAILKDFPDAYKKESPSLWQAANTPLGKDVNVKMQEENQRISDWIAMHAPPSMTGPLTQAARAPLDIAGAIPEMGRRTLTPMGTATMGLGGLMQELRQAINVPGWIKTGTAVGEVGTGGAFGAQGASETLKEKQPGESDLDALERRLSGLGQAIMGLAPIGHAIGTRTGSAFENVAAKAMAYEVRENVNTLREAHMKEMEQLQLEGLQKQNDIKAENARLQKENDEAYQKKVNEVGKDNTEAMADYHLKQKMIEQETAKKNAEAHQAWREKAQAKKREYENSISALEQKGRKTESQVATEAETKKKIKAARPSGPTYQRIVGMADKVASTDVPKLDKDIRSDYNANWGAWRQAMGDAQGDFTPVQDAVRHAEEEILKGSPENIATFRNILKEGEDPMLAQASVFRNKGGLNIKEVMGNRFSERYGITETVRRQIGDLAEEIESGEQVGFGRKEGVMLPIDDIRGYLTELQQKRMTGTFHGDVYRAMKYVEDAGNKVVERVAEQKGQLGTYKRLKANWSQYMEDFYDKDGALTKVKNAINPEGRLNLLTGDENSRIVSALGRYAKFNPQLASMVGRLRGMMTAIDEMSGTATRPEREAVPRAPVPQEPRQLQPPRLKETPEYMEAKLKEVPNMPDIVPFDTPKVVTEEVNKMAKKIGTSGHVLMTYWVLRDIFHGKAPSISMLAVPLVQRQITRYLRSPQFIRRVTEMVNQ